MGRNKIKELRDKAGLTQKELAESIGISTRALISLEAKEDLVNKHLPEIAKVTGFPEFELMGYELPEDIQTATRKLRDAYDARYQSKVDEYEDKIKKMSEKLDLQDGIIKSQEKAISSLEKLNKMLESQLDRQGSDPGVTEHQAESSDTAPTEQEIS